MPDFLFELGCEELPATFLVSTLDQLKAGIAARLDAAQLTYDSIEAWGTPRRSILSVKGLPDCQADSVKSQRGPALKAAYQADGTPAPALQGFCRGLGIDPSQVSQEGDYVWAHIPVTGSPTGDVLAALMPELIRSLTFPKTMRWGSGRVRFARPVRWMLAVLDGALVDFEFEGVRSGLTSMGHRFYHPEAFEAKTLDALFAGLRQRNVEPDPAAREAIIRDGSQKIASGKVEFTDDLVEENVFLTEWPMPVEGSFPEHFLSLPEPVLVTAMAKHERFFPVRGTDGKLLNRFISITNSGDAATVASGNEWVLNARFNDAKFFYDEDKKSTLADFFERTERMTFQEKLGSVKLRSARLAELAKSAVRLMGGNDNLQQLAAEAAKFSKADLSCGLVSELSSLQGIVGGEYAKRESMDPVIVHAIGTQYHLHKNLPATSDAQIAGVAVAVADQIDKLVGYLGLGLAPSGSSDPYGLRRAAQLIIDSGMPASALDLIHQAEALYDGLPITAGKAVDLIGPIFVGRYELIYSSERHDVVEAALATDLQTLLHPRLIAARVRAMAAAAGDPGLIQTATRPINIVAAAEKKGISIQPQPNAADLDSAEGVALLEAAKSISPCTADTAGVDSLKPLMGPINAFFDAAMVMVDDTRVRDARLAMLKQVANLLLTFGDFTKLVVEG